MRQNITVLKLVDFSNIINTLMPFVFVIVFYLPNFSVANTSIFDENISIYANNNSFSEIITTLEKKSGFEIDINGSFKKKVSVNVANASIDEVVKQIFRGVNHAIEINYSKRKIKIVIIDDGISSYTNRDHSTNTVIFDQLESVVIEDEGDSALLIPSRANRMPPIDR